MYDTHTTVHPPTHLQHPLILQTLHLQALLLLCQLLPSQCPPPSFVLPLLQQVAPSVVMDGALETRKLSLPFPVSKKLIAELCRMLDTEEPFLSISAPCSRRFPSWLSASAQDHPLLFNHPPILPSHNPLLLLHQDPLRFQFFQPPFPSPFLLPPIVPRLDLHRHPFRLETTTMMVVPAAKKA